MIVKFYFLWTFWQLFRTLHLASFPIEVTWIPENVPNDNSAVSRIAGLRSSVLTFFLYYTSELPLVYL